jgi:tRNA(Arg) A34 adenosine deaminase TadA
MCLGAIYWARPRRVIFANTQQQAAGIDFDDAFIYREIEKEYAHRRIPFVHMPLPSAEKIFETWKNKNDKKEY